MHWFRYSFFLFLTRSTHSPLFRTSPGSQGNSSSLPSSRLSFLVSRVWSTLPDRINPSNKPSQILVIYLRPQAFDGGNQILRRKSPTHRESTPRSLRQYVDSRTTTLFVVLSCVQVPLPRYEYMITCRQFISLPVNALYDYQHTRAASTLRRPLYH